MVRLQGAASQALVQALLQGEPMSSISVKGIIIGALFSTVAGFVASFIAILIISRTTGATTGAEMKAMADSSPFTVIWS